MSYSIVTSISGDHTLTPGHFPLNSLCEVGPLTACQTHRIHTPHLWGRDVSEVYWKKSEMMH